MLKHVELDPSRKLEEQFADTSDKPTILMNLFIAIVPISAQDSMPDNSQSDRLD